MDEELRQYLTGMEERIAERTQLTVRDSETRIVDHVLERTQVTVRDMETRIVANVLERTQEMVRETGGLLEDTEGISNYNGLQTKVTKRWSGKTYIDANFTCSGVRGRDRRNSVPSARSQRSLPMYPPPTSKSDPFSSHDSWASHATSGETFSAARGENPSAKRLFTSCPKGRSSFIRVRAMGATALTVTPSGRARGRR